jgi:hypothetical protein
MDVDVAQTAAAVVPYVTAVASAYGARTLEKLREQVLDQASDATVELGRRLLNRIFGQEESRAAIEGALVEVGSAPGDEDAVASLRLQIRKALAADPVLAAEVAQMVQSGPAVSAGDHGVAAGGDISLSATSGGVASWTIHGGVSTSGNPPLPGADQA